MATERQIAANRRNAQKSTGPKTKAGKARSRRNALKHGLAGNGIVLSAPDQKRVTKRLESFREKLAPVDELEEYLVTRIAMASVRAERAVERETAHVRRRTRRAARRWDHKQEQQTTRLARLLQTEPAAAVRGLRQSAGGCAWLGRQWRILGKALKAQGHWTHAQAAQAIRLLGKPPEVCGCTGGRVGQLRVHFLGALPEVDPEEAETILGLDPTGLDEAARLEAIASKLPEPDEARTVLRAIVGRQVRKLERLALRRWQHSDGPDRAEQLAIAQVDTTLEGVRLQRYESCHEMGVHRNLNELIKIRKQEPEMSSIARWEKTGKKYSRRWDGYAWVPNSEWRVLEDSEGGAGGWGSGSGEEPKTMTDGGWQMTDQTAGAVSDLVSHTSSVISHSPSAPVRHQPSVISHPGVSPAVWPGLSATCPGLPPDNGRLEEASGLVAEGPVAVSGGSLCSTPGTRSESHPEEKDADLPADDDVKVSGASLCSAPGTRSESDLEEGKSDLVADGHGKVTGASLCSAPGTRSGADERVGSLPSQAPPRVAGFSALREPGASQSKQEPAEKAMTDGKWLMTEQTPDPAPLSHLPQPLSHPSSAISHSSPTPLSHPPSVISHSSPSPFSHQPSAIRHPLPQPPTPNPQPLLAKAHLPADRSLPPATLPPNEPNPVDATNGAASGWNEAGAADRSGLDEALKRASQAWPSPVVFDPVW